MDATIDLFFWKVDQPSEIHNFTTSLSIIPICTQAFLFRTCSIFKRIFSRLRRVQIRSNVLLRTEHLLCEHKRELQVCVPGRVRGGKFNWHCTIRGALCASTRRYIALLAHSCGRTHHSSLRYSLLPFDLEGARCRAR